MHTLSLLRPLLRRIALTRRDQLAALQSTLDKSVEPPVILRLAQPYTGVPAAPHMSDDQISDALAAGRDPYAETNLAQPPTAPANPPLREMLVAARFAVMLESPELIDALTTPQALTFISVPSTEDQTTLSREISTTPNHCRGTFCPLPLPGYTMPSGGA